MMQTIEQLLVAAYAQRIACLFGTIGYTQLVIVLHSNTDLVPNVEQIVSWFREGKLVFTALHVGSSSFQELYGNFTRARTVRARQSDQLKHRQGHRVRRRLPAFCLQRLLNHQTRQKRC